MKKIAKNDGFTILEVLVSLLILSISLLLLLNMAMVALDGNDWSNRATSSTQLLQEKLEELRTDGIMANGADTVDNIVRNWQVVKADDYLRKISIMALWTNRKGDTLQNSMTAYVRTDNE